MKAFLLRGALVVGTIAGLLLCFVWLSGAVLIAAYECDDNCAATPNGAPWHQKTGSWQWSVQLAPTLLGIGAAALAFYFLSRGKYSAAIASFCALAAAFLGWFVLMSDYLFD
jgi:hypothetical protein